MRLTEPKIRQITLKIAGILTAKNAVSCENKEILIKKIYDSISSFLKIEDLIDDLVRKKIKTFRKNIPDGGQEWEILYKKYFEEELKKRKIF